MNVSEVKDLLAQFDASKVKTLDLTIDNVELHLSKNEGCAPTTPAANPQPVATNTTQTSAPVATKVDIQTSVSNEEPTSKSTNKPSGKTVDSPIVGVVYLSSAPEKPVFKKVGDKVAVGETLCIVEAMKLMNEITSDLEGTVTEILVENEEVVEYGQPLFRID